MRFSQSATSFLWFLPLALQCAIALLMLGRGLVKKFPVFFSYTVLVFVRDLILASLSYGRALYSSVFWWGEGAAVLLALGVVVEFVFHLVSPYRFLRLLIRVLWIAGLLAGASALAMLIWANGPSGTDLALEWIILTERSVRFLQVCLLIVAVALMSRLGLTWHHYSLGIVAGFGIYSALDLVLLELRAHLHVVADTTFVLLRSAAYNFCVTIWAFYFLWPQHEKAIERLPSTDMANWNDVLTEHIDKWYRRS